MSNFLEDNTFTAEDVFNIEVIVPHNKFAQFTQEMIEDYGIVNWTQFGSDEFETTFSRLLFKGSDEEAGAYVRKLYSLDYAEVYL